jgi:dihydroxyacetone kinase
VDAFIGDADHFNNLVGFVGHRISSTIETADGALAPSRA